MIRQTPRHPAVHIVLLGIVVALAILVARGPSTPEGDRRVLVTGADVVQLRAAFMRTWQREPTPSELRGEIEKLIRQEVLYREALARGYDRDDQVVRRAMQQKMEFLASSQGTREPPSEEEVEAFFALRQERYRLPAVFDLAQIYVNADAPDSMAEETAEELLGRLRSLDPAPQELAEWGDPIMLDPVYTEESEQDITSLFGADFAAALLEVEPGAWVGPIPSGYGLHLVKVLNRRDSRIPEWTEVGRRVRSDMEYEAGQAAREQLYQEIAQTYQIVLDPGIKELLGEASQ